MNPPKIVAYFTPSYLDEITGLKATASELGLHVDALAIHDMTWSQAVMFKPQFIYDRLASLDSKYDGILYTDADSRFRREPDWRMFDGIDFSCHRFYRSRICEPEMLTGTMYFGRGKDVLEFIGDWIEMTKLYTQSDTPEQVSLKAVWEKWRKKLNFFDITPSMCYIFDDFKTLYPGVTPTIEHLQASRRMRK